MKAIKSKNIAVGIICIYLLTGVVSSCKKLAGLPLQQNQEHVVSTIDPHVNMNAWDYLKSRALGTSSFKDSIFYRMYQGILYSGIDTNLYTKPGQTFIFLHNDAILRKSGTTTTTDSYFGKYKVNNAAATKWEDYPKDQVKNYLLYLITDGEYSFENVGPDVQYVQSLMPANYDTLNPQSIITFNVINDRDSRFRINGFPGSVLFTTTSGVITYGLQARTAGILSTNGPIHVVDRVLYYQKQ
jgi:hypothetical protein